MVIKFFLLSFLIFQIVPSKSQNLIIDDSTSLKRGIYRNFEEFKYNNPSITIDFTIEEKERRKFKELEDNPYIHYRLDFPKKLPFSEDSIWGFSDGNETYIKGEEEVTGKNNYDKIIYYGRYCYWYEFSGAEGDFSGTIRYSRNSILFPKAININNGTIFYLNVKSLKMILQKDTELLNQFNKEKKDFRDYFYYIRKYSAKYKDEIKRE